MADMQVSDLEALYRSPITLRGQYVTLMPLTLEHGEALFRALNGDEELWRCIPVAQPQTLAEMQDWITTVLEEQTQGRRLPFAVVEHASGQVIGSTSYVNMSYPNRNLDVGWTWYAREHWRTAVNTACKYLLLRYAFETLRCIRVQLRVDARNTCAPSVRSNALAASRRASCARPRYSTMATSAPSSCTRCSITNGQPVRRGSNRLSGGSGHRLAYFRPYAEQKVELTALGSIQSQHETFASKLSVVAGPLLSHKTRGYCWPTHFNVLGVLFLGEVSSAFLPSKKA